MDLNEIREALHKQEYEENLKLLIYAVLYQAAVDVQFLDPDVKDLTEKLRNAADAQEFINSPTFELICDSLAVKTDVMRNEIIRRAKRGDVG